MIDVSRGDTDGATGWDKIHDAIIIRMERQLPSSLDIYSSRLQEGDVQIQI
jgi:hypothetical protein